MPCEMRNKRHLISDSNVQEALYKVNRYYLINRSKHSVTQQLCCPELGGLQDSCVDLGPLLSRLQRLKALKAESGKVRTRRTFKNTMRSSDSG